MQSESRVATIYYLNCTIIKKSIKHTKENRKVWFIIRKEKSKQLALLGSPYTRFSRQRHQSSYYKYVQRTKENMLKELKESITTMTQQVDNFYK